MRKTKADGNRRLRPGPSDPVRRAPAVKKRGGKSVKLRSSAAADTNREVVSHGEALLVRRLSAELIAAHRLVRQASQTMHDEICAQLAGAGFLLQLRRMENSSPDAGLDPVVEAIGIAMARLRQLSHQLDPAPVRAVGLRQAFLDLVEKYGGHLDFQISHSLPPEFAADLVSLTERTLQAVEKGRGPNSLVKISGGKPLTVEILFSREGTRPSEFTVLEYFAESAGFKFEIRQTNGTMVSIQYAR